jgi:hypothetical protein
MHTRDLLRPERLGEVHGADVDDLCRVEQRSRSAFDASFSIASFRHDILRIRVVHTH